MDDIAKIDGGGVIRVFLPMQLLMVAIELLFALFMACY